MSLLDDLTPICATYDARLAAAVADAQTAHNDLAVALGQRDHLAADVAALTARVADLEAQLAAATKVVPPTLFGASIDGKSASGQTTMLAKWGPDAAGRQFLTLLSDVAPRDAHLSRLHVSWKPTSEVSITDAAVKAACVNLHPGDVVEVWHEADAKVNAGTLTMTAAVGRKNAFYAAVKRVRPDLVVANTLTGWAADPKNSTTKGNLEPWAAVRADLLGIDCDGIHPTSLPYPDFTDEIKAAVAFVAAHPGYSGWCVPEFGAPRVSSDVDGSARAAWAKDYAARFKAAGAAYVCAYEYASSTNNAFTTSAEVGAWKSLI